MNTAFIREVGLRSWLLRTIWRQLHKRVLRRAHEMYLPTGNRLLLPIDSYSATEAFITSGNIDWGSEARMARFISRDGAFLDVGANIGYYSVYFEPLVQRVIAFEPDPRARRHLVANVVGLRKVEVVSCAVGRETGITRFTHSPNTEKSHIAAEGEPGVEVPVVSIDDFVTERDFKVSGIKINASEHAFDAVQGAARVMREQRPLVLCELQPGEALRGLAESVDYIVFAYGRDPRTRKATFVQVDAPGAKGLVFKMMMLVPRERAEPIFWN